MLTDRWILLYIYRSGQHVQHPRVCWFLLIRVIPRTRLAVALEGRWHPGVLVCPVPDGDAYAAFGVETGAHEVGVVCLLLLQVGLGGLGGGGLHTHVHLGVGDDDVQSRIRLDSAGQVLTRRRLANGEVGLETDTVDACSIGLDETDQTLGCGGLGAGVFDAVVVVVQLGGWVCSRGCCKGNGDVCFSYGLVEDVVAVGSVLVQGCFS